MEKYVLIGANSEIALGTRKKLIESGASATCISRTENINYSDFILGNAVENELPEVSDSLDGIVYFPGSISLKPFRSFKANDFVNDFQLNVIGAINSIKKYYSNLKENSSIVLISTVAVELGMPYHSLVSTSKGAVEGLTRSLAAEFAPKIRVNCVAPSLTNTKLASKFLSNEQKLEGAKNRHPLKSVGSVDDIANAIIFLLRKESKWMSGQVLGVDGGISKIRT